MGIMGVGQYTRMQFSKSRFNWKQNLALFLCGTVLVLIIHNIKMDEIYKLSIVMVSSLLLHNIVNAILKGGDKGENKAAKNIENKIDSLTK